MAVKACANLRNIFLIVFPADVDQLVLLFVEYICIKKAIPIPWNDIAKLVNEHLTGEAIKQHLVKVRKFRISEGREVPDRIDRGTRRKVGKLAGGKSTPAKGGRARKVKDEDAEDDDDEAPVKGTTQRSSLLWHPPDNKPKPKPEGDDGTPKPVPAAARRTKKVKGDDDEKVDDNFTTPLKPSVKRGRKNKQNIKKGEDGDSDYDTPTKKLKVSSRLRATTPVNYKAQLEFDEDVFEARQEGDADGEYEEIPESQESVTVKQERSTPRPYTLFKPTVLTTHRILAGQQRVRAATNSKGVRGPSQSELPSRLHTTDRS